MTNHNIYRLVCLFLIALMLLPVVACGNNPEADGSNNAADTTTASGIVADTTPGDSDVVTEAPSNVDANGYLKDDLDPTLNFKNAEFTLLYWSDREHEEFYVESQTGDLVEGLSLGGQHDDGHLRGLADFLADIPAVHDGQHDVQQDEIRGMLQCEMQTVAAVVGDFDVKAVFFQI